MRRLEELAPIKRIRQYNSFGDWVSNFPQLPEMPSKEIGHAHRIMTAIEQNKAFVDKSRRVFVREQVDMFGPRIIERLGPKYERAIEQLGYEKGNV